MQHCSRIREGLVECGSFKNVYKTSTLFSSDGMEFKIDICVLIIQSTMLQMEEWYTKFYLPEDENSGYYSYKATDTVDSSHSPI